MIRKTVFSWLDILKIGLIFGIVGLLLALVGMVEEFSQRDIIAGVISMGQTLLFITFLFTGYMAAKRATGEHRWVELVSSALAGLVVSGILATLVLLMNWVNIRPILANASPTLATVLTLGQGLNPGLFLLLLIGSTVGLIGGGIQLLPSQIRRAVVMAMAWVALLGLLQELLRVTFTNLPLVEAATRWMFGRSGQRGLSIIGAVVIFIVITLGSYFLPNKGVQLQNKIKLLPSSNQKVIRWGGLLFALVVVLFLPNVLGPYLSEVTNSVGLFILMGLGLNIVVGFAGLLDLGYVAFFAIGAYVMGVLSTTGGELSTSLQLPFWYALPIAVLVTVFSGVLLGIPVLKMRGDYLAIVTLGFGEITRILALSDFLKPHIGGSQGIVEVGTGSLGRLIVFDNPQSLFYLILAGCILALFTSRRLRDSRLGRAWKAMREDEDVAQAMGIELVSTKLLAFATGAGFSGLSGAIFASKIGSIYPHSFGLLISINVLSLIIVGGMGSVPGVFVGAVLLVGLPELLREFAEYRMLMYGALLIVMMLTKPEGFWPEATHKRELHEAELSPVENEA